MNQTPSAETIVLEKTPAASIVRVNVKLLDDVAIGKLTQAIDSITGDNASPLVVIDLARVEYLPSLCLGALVQISNTCRSRQQKLKLATLRPMIRKVFTTTRLDRVLELVDTVEAAVQ